MTEQNTTKLGTDPFTQKVKISVAAEAEKHYDLK
jgi:hypothetical protein